MRLGIDKIIDKTQFNPAALIINEQIRYITNFQIQIFKHSL